MYLINNYLSPITYFMVLNLCGANKLFLLLLVETAHFYFQH